ncbi:hypothetical protein DSUL_60175 [Desulfovibrionales bacterium]
MGQRHMLTGSNSHEPSIIAESIVFQSYFMDILNCYIIDRFIHLFKGIDRLIVAIVRQLKVPNI